MPEPTRLWELAVPAFVAAAIALLFLPIVEALKLWLSRRSWEAQERWKLKREIYASMLNSLHEMMAVHDARSDLEGRESLQYTHSATGPDAPKLPDWWVEYAKKRRDDLEKRWARARERFDDGRGSFPLVVSDTTVEALRNLDREAGKARHDIEHNEAVWQAYKEVLASAKADLKV